MKASHALDRMRIELRQLVAALNQAGEYEHSLHAQQALITVDEIDPLDVEIPSEDDGPMLTRADVPLLRDAVSYLRRHQAGDNAPNLALATDHLQQLMQRAQQ
jgi:hypothetical protein